MALNQKMSLSLAIVALQAVINTLSSATIDVYDGVQPATADTPITTQTRLITFTFGSPAFGPPISNIAVANAIAPSVGIATGFPSWFRVTTSTALARFDGSVGTGGTFNMVLNGAGIAVGQGITITSCTFEVPLG